MRVVLKIILIGFLVSENILSQTIINNSESSKEVSKWKSIENLPRIEFGIEKSGYIGFGFSRLWNNSDVDTKFIMCYSSIGISMAKTFDVKIGLEERLLRYLPLSLDLKYQSNFTKYDFLITPKVELWSVWGYVNLFYGYNISFNNYPFSKIGQHEFSVDILMYKIKSKLQPT